MLLINLFQKQKKGNVKASKKNISLMLAGTSLGHDEYFLLFGR
jgi:hypothetical protein